MLEVEALAQQYLTYYPSGIVKLNYTSLKNFTWISLKKIIDFRESACSGPGWPERRRRWRWRYGGQWLWFSICKRCKSHYFTSVRILSEVTCSTPTDGQPRETTPGSEFRVPTDDTPWRGLWARSRFAMKLIRELRNLVTGTYITCVSCLRFFSRAYTAYMYPYLRRDPTVYSTYPANTPAMAIYR